MTNLRYVLMLMVFCTLASGCVRRRMTIRSSPPGALVFVDGQEIGRTPVATPFIYYGTRNLRLVKDGYETISINQPFHAPWYQVPPLDFVSENMVPHELRDERVVDFEMVPMANVSMDDVLIHADQLRSEVVPATAQSFNGAQPVDAGILEYGGSTVPSAVPNREINPPAATPGNGRVDFGPVDYAPTNTGPADYAPADYAPADYAPADYAPAGTPTFAPPDYGGQGGPAAATPGFGGFNGGFNSGPNGPAIP